MQNLAEEVLEAELTTFKFNENTLTPKTKEICGIILDKLIKMKKQYKYFVNLVLMQKNGAAIHTSVSSLIDSAYDGCVSLKFPKTRSKGIQEGVTGILTIHYLSV